MSNSEQIDSVEDREIQGLPGTTTGDRSVFLGNDRGSDELKTIIHQNQFHPTVEWGLINNVITEKLSELTDQVQQIIPDLIWKSASHSARHIALSSYRIFYHTDGNDFDPIYAGITLVEEEGLIRITGDISGDETGHVYFDQDCEIWVNIDHESVLKGVVEVATILSTQNQIVVETIGTPRIKRKSPKLN